METIIIYSTLTGNTEVTTEWIRDRLVKAGHNVVTENAGNVYPDTLEEFDLIILGSPTYWSGDVTDDFIPFLEKMTDMDLAGKKAAVFGLGDSDGYPEEFAHAVEIIENMVARTGADLAVESLKIDGDPELSREIVVAWVDELNATVNQAYP